MKGEALRARPCIRGRTGILELQPRVSECAARTSPSQKRIHHRTAATHRGQGTDPRRAGLDRVSHTVSAQISHKGVLYEHRDRPGRRAGLVRAGLERVIVAIAGAA